jgi:GTPase
MKNKPETRTGYIAISGKPNVGKSTLLNGFLGKKIAITSRKPQTTRQRILGIKTVDDAQMLFVDTPGIHLRGKKELNRRMNRVARGALTDVDVVLFVTDLSWDKQDEYVLELVSSLTVPVILIINKVDHLKDKKQLLPLMQERSGLMEFAEIIPMSALREKYIGDVEANIIPFLPSGTHFFSPEQFTDRSDRFMISEMVREKLMRLLGQELPYRTAVSVEHMEETPERLNIHVIIWVEKDTHKGIVIGGGGQKLKQIGTEARMDIERFFGKSVVLKSWVKVKSGWSDSSRFLDELGLD